MKKNLVLVVFLLTACSCGTRKPNARTNYNLDFEEIDNKYRFPIGWAASNTEGIVGNPKNSDVYKVDSVVKQNGKYSLLIDWKEGDKAWTVSSFAINNTFQGAKVKLTGHLKTENLTDWAGLWLRVDGKDNTIAVDNMQSRPIKGTTGWKEYSITLDYDKEKASRIVFGCFITGSGKIWMDNLHLSIDNKDISQVATYQKGSSIYKAHSDTSFNRISGITTITTTPDKIRTLTTLGMLWGFLKYYHSSIQRGEVNMDAELFRLLPKIIAADNEFEVNKIMEDWVDRLGIPDSCQCCSDIIRKQTIKLLPSYNQLFIACNLPTTLISKLAFIRENRYTSSDHYYVTQSNVGNPEFCNELPYNENFYPDAGIRLLALYRYWNIIQYYYPYRHLIGEDWNKVLKEMLPEFLNASNAMAYEIACLHLIARINDSHAILTDESGVLKKMKGEFYPFFKTAFIEDKLVIIGFYADSVSSVEKNKVQIGDVIQKIDGMPVSELVKKYLSIVSASNYPTKLRELSKSSNFLLTGHKKEVHIQLLRREKIFEENVQRNTNDHDDYEFKSSKLIDDSIGYIYPGNLTNSDFENIREKYKNAKGIIIDMRCYPNTFMPFIYGSWLKAFVSPFAIYSSANVNRPGMFVISDTISNGSIDCIHYNGKLVIIVNEQTQSQAEYTTMALSTVPGCVVVGSTTAGADGDVSGIVLPGGIQTRISGIGVLYPDGTETQRKGVKIDKIVKPTIKGIRDGRDELLEYALQLIKTDKH